MSSNPDILTSKVAFSIATGVNNELLLSVTPLDYFNEEICQADWTPEEVFIELEHMGYPQAAELMEAIIELPTGTDKDELISKLEASELFVHDENFVLFCKQFESDEFTVIY